MVGTIFMMTTLKKHPLVRILSEDLIEAINCICIVIVFLCASNGSNK
jgi:hypothetical protein